MMRSPVSLRLIPALLTLLLLAGFTADQLLFRVAPADAAPYHAAVQQAATRIPLHMGSWLGEDVPVPPAAVQLLKPNVIVSRRYTDLRSGRRFDFLLVQCSDIRDILGHYPPVCYRGQGWTTDAAEPGDWETGDLTITGTSYTFERKRQGLPARLVVYNFILLPDGRICRGMDEADEAAQDLRRKYFGAAQVQLVFDGSVPEDVRDEVLQMTVAANRDLFDTIRRGEQNEQQQ
jgi:hypothetical protein